MKTHPDGTPYREPVDDPGFTRRDIETIVRRVAFDDAANRLRELFEHGHPDFLPITLKELELHSAKNHDYAKGGSPLGNFERVSYILALYPKLRVSDKRVVALVYALKQLDAVLWGLSEGIEHKVEGITERLRDVSIYSKIVMCMEGETRCQNTGAHSRCE